MSVITILVTKASIYENKIVIIPIAVIFPPTNRLPSSFGGRALIFETMFIPTVVLKPSGRPDLLLKQRAAIVWRTRKTLIKAPLDCRKLTSSDSSKLLEMVLSVFSWMKNQQNWTFSCIKKTI